MPDEKAILDFERREQKAKVTYLPSTFEGMMECFGVNLQRKNHYDRLHDQIKAMNTLTKVRDGNTDKQIREAVSEAGDAMRSILSTSIADSVLLKNRHNELFIKLMDSLGREKD